MKILFFLAICSSACQSPTSKVDRSASANESATKPPEKLPTLAERREYARDLLAQAGGEGTFCSKGEIYQRIADEFSDLPEAKFARKNMVAIKNQVKILQTKSRRLLKDLEKYDSIENDLNNSIAAAEDLGSSCGFEEIKDMAIKEANYYKGLRLKKFGY